MRTKTKLMLIFALAVWFKLNGSLYAFPRSCSNVCNLTGADCNTLCYMSDPDFQNGTYATCLDYGVYSTCPGTPPPTPGDGTPGSGEGGSCPDGSCNNGETCDSCPADCSCLSCGDSVCDTPSEYGGGGSGNPPQCSSYEEWCQYCPEDCGDCDALSCYPQVCGGESSRYQCTNCSEENQDCAIGWCAYGFDRSNQCENWCDSNYECPTGYFCSSGHDCVETPGE